MTVLRSAGRQWKGAVDLLLQLRDGDVVLVDHNTVPIRREHCQVKAAAFTGQLGAYREVVAAGGETVRSAYIHFPLAGVVAELERGGG